jgi:hypothetical protein
MQVPDYTLADLHEVIQATMGWENSHLHQFIVDGVRYRVREQEPSLKNENKVLLSQIARKAEISFVSRCEYDFGDSWVHDVAFEGHSPNDLGQSFPVCLAAIVADCQSIFHGCN